MNMNALHDAYALVITKLKALTVAEGNAEKTYNESVKTLNKIR
jgi:hypothetical protein